MRKIIFATVLAMNALMATDCAAQKKQTVQYEFPEAMAPQIRTQYEQLAAKGHALYQLTCAQCHGGKKKGKEFIPDFTLEQLEAYQIRVGNAKHESALQESSLNAEELSLITIFFTYKKKNEVSKKEKLKKTDDSKTKIVAH